MKRADKKLVGRMFDRMSDTGHGQMSFVNGDALIMDYCGNAHCVLAKYKGESAVFSFGAVASIVRWVNDIIKKWY